MNIIPQRDTTPRDKEIPAVPEVPVQSKTNQPAIDEVVLFGDEDSDRS